MNFILQNWYWIIIAGVALAYAIIGLVKFAQAPTEQQLIQLKSWMLYAVTEAQKKFGQKTGQIKLAYVYDMFATKFPALAKIITFNFFSSMVDEVLDKFKTILQNNQNLKAYVQEKEVQPNGTGQN